MAVYGVNSSAGLMSWHWMSHRRVPDADALVLQARAFDALVLQARAFDALTRAAALGRQKAGP